MTTPHISQYQLRAQLEAMVLGDLLGPVGGEGEELTERTVRDRYLVGVMAPSRSANAAAKPAVDGATKRSGLNGTAVWLVRTYVILQFVGRAASSAV